VHDTARQQSCSHSLAAVNCVLTNIIAQLASGSRLLGSVLVLHLRACASRTRWRRKSCAQPTRTQS
jgi:hypothetical protein